MTAPNPDPDPDAFPLVSLNGQILESARACLSVFDRGFFYGDGLFETVRVCRGRLFRWNEHLDRLWTGLAFLGVSRTFTRDELSRAAISLVTRNEAREAVLRVAVSRGVGARGYSTRTASEPTVLLTLHRAARLEADHWQRWNCHLARTVRLFSGDTLAAHKTFNKLPHILARMEAEAAGADEALLTNESGQVMEAASGNLFWIHYGGIVGTPPLTGAGLLPGITRQAVLEICRASDWTCRESPILPDALAAAEGVFLTLSSLGVVEVAALNGRPLTSSPKTQAIQRKLARAMIDGQED